MHAHVLQNIGSFGTTAWHATPIAAAWLQDDKLELWCLPKFVTQTIDGSSSNALRMDLHVTPS